MALYDVGIDYNGRKVILHSDPDKFVFVNHGNITWEDGTPLTVDETVEFLKYYGRNHITPPCGEVAFMDGQDEYYGGYGLVIDFDENGEPQYKIEDGKILSSQVLCDCERIGAKHIRVASQEELEAFRANLVNSGTFTLLNEAYKVNNIPYYQYKCNKCGDIWLIAPHTAHLYAGNLITMICKKHYETGLKRRGEDTGSKAKRLLILILLLLLTIAGTMAFIFWLNTL